MTSNLHVAHTVSAVMCPVLTQREAGAVPSCYHAASTSRFTAGKLVELQRTCMHSISQRVAVRRRTGARCERRAGAGRMADVPAPSAGQHARAGALPEPGALRALGGSCSLSKQTHCHTQADWMLPTVASCLLCKLPNPQRHPYSVLRCA